MISVTGTPIILFTSISGSYTFEYDSSPDLDISNPNDGTDSTNFKDGVAFLWGDVIAVDGTFNGGTGNGSNFLTSTIAGYLAEYIQADPTSNEPLTGTTFDTTIRFFSPELDAVLGVGDRIGDPYTVQENDVILIADANTLFEATPVPEPSVLLLLSAAMLGIGAVRIRSRNA